MHLARTDVPLALHDLHRCLAVDAPASIVVSTGDEEVGPYPGDDFPVRRLSYWPEQLLIDVLTGAGFEVTRVDHPTRPPLDRISVEVTRGRTLADTVGPDMRLLVCGLNPSVWSADVGVGFARPGNRFWPAALDAGIVSVDRDPVHALRRHGVGLTDLVKRATPRADGLTRDEYRDGLARIDRLATWLSPRAICFVGLAGWRAATDRNATAGIQERTIGDRPVYVMPSTSGVNASSSRADLATHLAAAAALADAN